MHGSKLTDFPNTESLADAPVVLLVSRRYVRKNKYIDFMGEFHLDLLQKNGACPVIIPRTDRTDQVIDVLLPMIDGVMVVEGEDLGPAFEPYGSQPSLAEETELYIKSKYSEDTAYDDSKDRVELKLLDYALANGTPCFGICRGCQLMNVLCGGTLYRDVQSQIPDAVCHLSRSDYDAHRHSLYIVPETPLADWYRESMIDDACHEKNLIAVNSYHHQGVRVLAPNLVPMGYSPDGLIEAFYDPDKAFFVGLQFHPERMLEDYPGNSRIYADFVSACRAYRRSKRFLETLQLSPGGATLCQKQHFSPTTSTSGRSVVQTHVSPPTTASSVTNCALGCDKNSAFQ